MSHELSYETYIYGEHSNRLEDTIQENEEYKQKIEQEIFALICMDPTKIRNFRKHSKSDYEDLDYLNNAQYLSKLWNDLKEQWENANSKIIRCSDAKYAVERDTREIYLCPDCNRELEYSMVKNDNGRFYNEELMCPVCKKIFTEYDDNSGKEKPIKATIRTFSEG